MEDGLEMVAEQEARAGPAEQEARGGAGTAGSKGEAANHLNGTNMTNRPPNDTIMTAKRSTKSLITAQRLQQDRQITRLWSP